MYESTIRSLTFHFNILVLAGYSFYCCQGAFVLLGGISLRKSMETGDGGYVVLGAHNFVVLDVIIDYYSHHSF